MLVGFVNTGGLEEWRCAFSIRVRRAAQCYYLRIFLRLVLDGPKSADKAAHWFKTSRPGRKEKGEGCTHAAASGQMHEWAVGCAVKATGCVDTMQQPVGMGEWPVGCFPQAQAHRFVRLVVMAATETMPKPGKDGSMPKPDKAHKKMLEEAEKAERKRVRKEAEARAALYLLHWHCAETLLPAAALAKPQQDDHDGAAAAEGQTRQYIMTLQEDLARMEKVSKVSE